MKQYPIDELLKSGYKAKRLSLEHTIIDDVISSCLNDTSNSIIDTLKSDLACDNIKDY